MMFSLKVQNEAGDILDLTGTDKYVVYKIEGLSPPQATINKSVNTTRDGSKVGNVRVESRNIVIYTTIEGDVEGGRNNLYRYFQIKKEVTLYYKNGVRDVFIKGIVEMIECDLFTEKQIAQISIVCAKPYFNDVDYIVTNFSDISSLFEFPFSIPESGIEFSAIMTNVRKSIINVGDVETGTIIKIFAVGTVANPIIYDVMKKEHMKLNFTMQASDTIIINTNVGEKGITLVRNGVSSNLLGQMEKDSSWFVLVPGDNVFAFTCDSGEANLQITFTTSAMYAGV